MNKFIIFIKMSWNIKIKIVILRPYLKTRTMREVIPQETSRAYAFEMWMKAPMPMVTFFKKLNVTNLAKISRKKGLKFNMLICYCIGRAASKIKEFYILPVDGKLIQYDKIAVNTIVANINNASKTFLTLICSEPNKIKIKAGNWYVA